MKWITTFLLLICTVCTTQAQNLTAVVTIAPCDSNGVITSTYSGSPGTSYVFTYYNSSFYSTYTVSSNVHVYPYYTGEDIYVECDAYNGSTYVGGGYQNVQLQPPFPVSVNVLTGGLTGCNVSLGSINCVPNGGTAPYTYNYYSLFSPANTVLNGSSSQMLQNGFYKIKVIDANGCAYYNNDSISLFNYGWSMGIQQTSTVANCTNGTASITNITNGTAPYIYLWNNGSTNSSINNLQTGVYKVIVTDAIGCIDSTNVFVGQSTNISPNLVNTSATCIQSNGASTSFPSGGTAPYSYIWSTGATGNVLSNVPASNYTLYITDANNCIGIGYAYLNASTPIVATHTTVGSQCTLNNGSISLNISGGAAPYSVTWNTNPVQTTTSISNLATGSYHFSITDANGCKQQGNVLVPVLNTLSATTASTASACSTANGNGSVVVVGGTPPYTYAWSTNPVQSTSSATNLSIGNYNVSITDASGCFINKNINVAAINLVLLATSNTAATCSQSNGSASIVASAGTPPYTYNWNTGATTSSLANVPSGGYNCIVTDAAACVSLVSIQVPKFNPMAIGTQVTNASCIYNLDGAITTTVTGATLPVTYYWNNGASTSNISNIPKGNYFLNITDAIGCFRNINATVSYNAANTSCYCTVSGKVYADGNNNCTLDGTEVGINAVRLDCSNGNAYYTDANGDYSFIVPSGSYTLTQIAKTNYPIMSCQNSTINFTATTGGTCVINNNFADSIILKHDMHISTHAISAPRPGFDFKVRAIVSNLGTINETNALATFSHDAQLAPPTIIPSTFWSNASGNLYNTSASTYSFVAGTSKIVDFEFLLGSNVPLSTNLWFNDSCAYTSPISNWTNDETPINNVNEYITTVVGAYDPNFKEVAPKGKGTNGGIYCNDSTLEYFVHFQNLGTYYAQNVVVLDTLDSNLDWASFEPLYNSHKCKVSLSSTGVVRYEFKNIHLSWKQFDEPGSQGMFSYRINTKTRQLGTTFKNSAAIYFDFNAPIITNQTLNTIIAPPTPVYTSAVATPCITTYPSTYSFVVSNTTLPPKGTSVALLINGVAGGSFNAATGAGTIPIAASGTYTFTLKYINGLTASQRDTVIIFNQNYATTITQPTISGGIYCLGSTFTINPSTIADMGTSPQHRLKINGTVVSTSNTTFVWTPIAANTYTIVREVLAGPNPCNTNWVVSATTNITIGASPSITISTTPNNATVCAGNTLTITATGATSYTITPAVTNNVGFVPSASGTYTIVGADANGCSATQTQSIIVQPNALLSAMLSSSPSVPKIAQSTVYSINTTSLINYQIQWYKANVLVSTTNDPVNTFTTTATSLGDSVYAIITPYNGCFAPGMAQSNTIKISTADAIEAVLNNGINLYPNPVQSEVHIEGLNINDNIKVLNVIGKVVYTTTATSSTMHLHTNALSSGIYTVLISNTTGVKVAKFIKN